MELLLHSATVSFVQITFIFCNNRCLEALSHLKIHQITPLYLRSSHYNEFSSNAYRTYRFWLVRETIRDRVSCTTEVQTPI